MNAEADVESGLDRLRSTVQSRMPDADDDSVRIVTALTGLLGSVAYADGEFSPTEEAVVAAALDRFRHIDESGAHEVCKVLLGNIVEISTLHQSRCASELKELADREQLDNLLAVLLEVAAADGQIAAAEIHEIRRIADAVGLSEQDYEAIRDKFRDKLAPTDGSG